MPRHRAPLSPLVLLGGAFFSRRRLGDAPLGGGAASGRSYTTPGRHHHRLVKKRELWRSFTTP